MNALTHITMSGGRVVSDTNPTALCSLARPPSLGRVPPSLSGLRAVVTDGSPPLSVRGGGARACVRACVRPAPRVAAASPAPAPPGSWTWRAIDPTVD